VVPTVEEIFDTLKNGKWHDFMEISEKTRWSMVKLKMLTNFLAEYEFIELDERKQRTRLTPSVLIFLKKIQEANEKRR
jgi:DNA-binding IclR family transcriptional regulator